jgi:hypothetical protein
MAFSIKTKTTSLDLRKAWALWVSKSNRGNEKAMANDEKSATKARDFIWGNSKILASATADRSYLEAFLKSKLALLMKESKESSIAGKEMDAKANPEYIDLLEAIKIAQHAEIELKWKMESAKISFEIYRTESANNRAIDRAMT